MSDDTEGSAEQFIDFKCSYCGADTSFRAEEAGTVQECPFCPEVFIVPLKNGAPGQPIPIPIATPRLSLRQLGSGDVADLAAFMNDEELVRYMKTLSMDESGVASWIEQNRAKHAFPQRHPLWLAIVLQESQKVIGWASVHYYRAGFCPGRRVDTWASPFVLVSPQYQRKGFGLEVVQHLLNFVFTGINVRRVTAACDSRNVAGKALSAKAGLRPEGEFFHQYFLKDECIDVCYFAMLSGEFQA